MAPDRNAQFFREIVEKARDAVITSDRDGLIELWDTVAERMFGYSKSEALGQSLDLIIPESLRNRHWEGYHKVMAARDIMETTVISMSPEDSLVEELRS
jgi:PAS domain S-box-containing protein